MLQRPDVGEVLVTQQLAAICHLFDRRVTGPVIPTNPAGSVCGPSHVVTSGQTPVHVYTQNRRLWVRLREKGGKATRCHVTTTSRNDGAGLRDDPKGPLFNTIGRGSGKLMRTAPQANAYAMISRAGKRSHARKGGRNSKPRFNAHEATL
jgi:integrase/recombinase XerC